MKRFASGFAPLVVGLAFSMPAVAQGTIEQAISAKYTLTKATADRSDIVTAGSIIVLKKDGLMTFATTASSKAQETYKDGKIQLSSMTKLMSTPSIFGHGANVVHRTFVAGEKLWLIDIQKADDGIVLQLLSDAINDVRYTALLKFPVAKGQAPVPDQILGQIAQVMEAQAGDAGGSNATAAGPSAAPAPAPAAPPPAPMAEIPPPPPPPDQAPAASPTLAPGQTPDQVIAILGQPSVKTGTGARQIFIYKDSKMKITFVNNKLSKVE